jgi:hypothetical protein
VRAILITVVAVLGLIAWRAELYPVGRGTRPQPLVANATTRAPVRIEVVLPKVPAGLARLVTGRGAVLVHYWAPWELEGRTQVTALDSLRRAPGLEDLDVTLVCFDPFPSVARG